MLQLSVALCLLITAGYGDALILSVLFAHIAS